MEDQNIREIVDQYILLSHNVWKLGEALVKDEIDGSMTNDQLYILRYISKQGKCTTTELANAFYVQKSAITAIINRLFEKNIIERTPDPVDRRVSYLSLTEEGKELFDKQEKKVQSLVKSFITQFEQEEIESFLKTYKKIADLLKEMR